MTLRWIQRYSGTYMTPLCEFVEQCGHHAEGMWADGVGKGHDLCELHAAIANAPPMEEGVWYAPTHQH